MRGADVLCAFRGIRQGLAKLRNQHGEVRLRHKRGWPQAAVQVLFRHCTWPLLYQDGEEIEGLGREMDLAVVLEELTPRKVQAEVTEPDGQSSSQTLASSLEVLDEHQVGLLD